MPLSQAIRVNAVKAARNSRIHSVNATMCRQLALSMQRRVSTLDEHMHSSIAGARWSHSSTTAPPTEEKPQKRYSPTTEKIVLAMARLMGYYSKGSIAIRASHDLYRACAQQAEQHKAFFNEACSLPDNFQSWFSVTLLHVWMLMVRLRAEKNGKLYIQELVNRFFDDVEDRIRQHDITQQKVINSYIKDLLAQFHGGVVAYDEGMCKDDPVLAAALWRNLFAPTSNNAEDLAFMVKYVRRELKALDDYDGEKLNAGIVQFGKPEASF